jgi:YD repeat-containing protein
MVRRSLRLMAGQTAVSYTYDNTNRLTQIVQGSSSVTFTCDPANRRTSVTLPNGVVGTHGYDAASELTGMTYKNGSTTLGNLTYAYDGDGRRITIGGQFRQDWPASGDHSALYNANNRLVTSGTKNLTYDLDGNLTGDSVNNYTWNARNHLASGRRDRGEFQLRRVGPPDQQCCREPGS